MTRELAAAWLAGMIDGEGCIYFNPEQGQRTVTISTTETDLLAAITSALDTLGINWRVSEQKRNNPRHATCFDVRIQRFEDFVILYEEVPIRSERKKKKLQCMLLSYVRKMYDPGKVERRRHA